MMCPGCQRTVPRNTPLTCAYEEGAAHVSGTCPFCQEVFHVMGGVGWTEKKMNEIRGLLAPLASCQKIFYATPSDRLAIGNTWAFWQKMRIGGFGVVAPESMREEGTAGLVPCVFLPEETLVVQPCYPVEKTLLELHERYGAALYSLSKKFYGGFEICSLT